MHYNYFRDCEPGIGRYVQSDPIGMEGGLNTFGYAASSPLAGSDAEGLDYWIEGAAENERRCPEQGCGLHQSFCVGQPYGTRYCISFGRTGGQGWCFLDCKGKVYEDRSPAGPIDRGSYRRSDAATDAKITRRIKPRIGQEGRYDFAPGANNCRTFSQNLFDEIDREFKGNASAPPEPPRPRGGGPKR